MIPMKLARISLASGIFALASLDMVYADVPRLIHYQGKLRDAVDVAVNDTVSLRFRLYGHATQAAPVLLDETHGSVAVTGGLFSVLIGAATIGGVPDSAIDSSNVYIGIAIDGGDELAPRTPLVSTGYALKARSAEQLVRPGTFQSAVSVDLNGNVGIGTATPGETLEIAGNLKAAAITGLTTPLSVNQGGTGASSLTGLLVGNGSGAFTTIAPGTSGNVLTSSGGSWVSSPAAGGVPSGAVFHFNLAACPTGWTELTAARGRYLVGLPAGGTLAGAAGTALTNLENRPTGQHTHGVQYSTENPAGTLFAEPFDGGNPSVNQTTGVTGGAVAGTNAPYMQLLVCQKD